MRTSLCGDPPEALPRKKYPVSMTPMRHDTGAEAPRQDLKMIHVYDLRAEINHPV